jgi:hypothetical protein
MAAFKKDSEQGRSKQSRPAMPRDLIDFYWRWSDFRPMVEALAKRRDLSRPQRQAVRWLIRLADRVSKHDLEPAGGSEPR